MDGSNVEYYAKLIRHGCEKASRIWMQTTSNTLQNLCGKGLTIILKSIKNHPKSIQTSLKIMKKQPLKRDPKKTRFFLKKATFRQPARWVDLAPKVVQNGIRKSWKSRHRTSIQKWCPKGRKGMEHGANMVPKIMKNPYKSQCRKSMEKILNN